MACKALDGQLAVPVDDEVRKLLDQFVCVRVVQMWGLDLSRFQFDASLTWAVFLLNADGTIYARYGSRSGLGEKSDDEISLEGFKKTLRGALELHQRYQKDEKALGKTLAAKTGPEPIWKTPESIPELRKKGRYSGRFTGVRTKRSNCIHCHMIHTFGVPSLRAAGREIPDRKFWPYPMPDELGLRMDPKEIATVEAVFPDSVAARSGFEPGDRILTLKGQPILSTADIQWVLHWAGDPETLDARIERGGQRRSVGLALEKGWRLRIGDWRWMNLALQRQLLQIMFKPLPMKERAARGIRKDALAFFVERIPRGAAVRGVRKGDVIVAVDGKRDFMNLGAFTAYVYRQKSPGDTVELTLLRGEEERRVEIPVR